MFLIDEATNIVAIDPAQADSISKEVTEQLTDAAAQGNFDFVLQTIIGYGVELGKKILIALAIYFVGRWIIKMIKRGVNRLMERRNTAPEIRSFMGSVVNVTLTVLLIITVISALGIETTSFAALIASAGVAIGMAMSGQMQNLAGGVMILLQKPYRIGDYIETNGKEGSVKSIQIFNTYITTIDNKTIIIPNGSISNSVLTNFSTQENRRVDLTVSVEYGQDINKAQQVLMEVINANEKIMKDSGFEPFIGLVQLADSSVNLTVRVWGKAADYWDIYFYMNRQVYDAFNKAGVGFPFPQITVHQAAK
ncbi:MAG: mechanosensitive ion channel [Paludibacteraceae bacterium]|nr:mechanosensitive ion channel [Paludibacteraceae bacterium]